MFKFITTTPTEGPANIITADINAGFSSNWMFINVFANRTNNTDTEFRGAVVDGSAWGKLYMAYLHASETLQVNYDIDNKGLAVIGKHHWHYSFR